MKNKEKWLLYFGTANILTGLMLKLADVPMPPATLFFVLGGATILVYVWVIYMKGAFKPRFEFLYLAAGLLLLAMGLNLRRNSPESFFGTALIAKAVILKATFLFFVIRRLRRSRMRAMEVPASIAPESRGAASQL